MVRAEADLNRAKQHVRGLQELMTSLEAEAVARAAMELANAKVEVENAEKVLASVKSAYEAAKFQPVKAPPDAYFWSLIAGPGEFVRAGAPVATWVDCGFMLVDVMSSLRCWIPMRRRGSSSRATPRYASERCISPAVRPRRSGPTISRRLPRGDIRGRTGAGQA